MCNVMHGLAQAQVPGWQGDHGKWQKYQEAWWAAARRILAMISCLVSMPTFNNVAPVTI